MSTAVNKGITQHSPTSLLRIKTPCPSPFISTWRAQVVNHVQDGLSAVSERLMRVNPPKYSGIGISPMRPAFYVSRGILKERSKAAKYVEPFIDYTILNQNEERFDDVDDDGSIISASLDDPIPPPTLTSCVDFSEDLKPRVPFSAGKRVKFLVEQNFPIEWFAPHTPVFKAPNAENRIGAGGSPFRASPAPHVPFFERVITPLSEVSPPHGIKSMCPLIDNDNDAFHLRHADRNVPPCDQSENESGCLSPSVSHLLRTRRAQQKGDTLSRLCRDAPSPTSARNLVDTSFPSDMDSFILEFYGFMTARVRSEKPDPEHGGRVLSSRALKNAVLKESAMDQQSVTPIDADPRPDTPATPFKFPGHFNWVVAELEGVIPFQNESEELKGASCKTSECRAGSFKLEESPVNFTFVRLLEPSTPLSVMSSSPTEHLPSVESDLVIGPMRVPLVDRLLCNARYEKPLLPEQTHHVHTFSVPPATPAPIWDASGERFKTNPVILPGDQLEIPRSFLPGIPSGLRTKLVFINRRTNAVHLGTEHPTSSPSTSASSVSELANGTQPVCGTSREGTLPTQAKILDYHPNEWILRRQELRRQRWFDDLVSIECLYPPQKRSRMIRMVTLKCRK